MVGEFWTGHHLVTPPVSLVIILSLLGVSIVASIVAQKRETARPEKPAEADRDKVAPVAVEAIEAHGPDKPPEADRS